jgi:hypothetical protein
MVRLLRRCSSSLYLRIVLSFFVLFMLICLCCYTVAVQCTLRFKERSGFSDYVSCISVTAGTKLVNVYNELKKDFRKNGYELRKAFSDVGHTTPFSIVGRIFENLDLYGEGIRGMSDAEQAHDGVVVSNDYLCICLFICFVFYF